MSTDLIRDEGSHTMTNTSKREVAGQTGYLDAKYDTSGDPLLPDLGNPAAQDDALGMLVNLQDGADPAQARMLAAIHNLLYDQWSEKGATL